MYCSESCKRPQASKQSILGRTLYIKLCRVRGQGKKPTTSNPKYILISILNYILEGMQSLQSFHALKQPPRFINTISFLDQFPWGSSCPIPNITFKYISKISLQIMLLSSQVGKNLLAILLVCQLNPGSQSGLFAQGPYFSPSGFLLQEYREAHRCHHLCWSPCRSTRPVDQVAKHPFPHTVHGENTRVARFSPSYHKLLVSLRTYKHQNTKITGTE